MIIGFFLLMFDWCSKYDTLELVLVLENLHIDWLIFMNETRGYEIVQGKFGCIGMMNGS